MSESAPAARPRCSSHDNGVSLAVPRSHETLLQYCH